jgi:hypothetical protein
MVEARKAASEKHFYTQWHSNTGHNFQDTFTAGWMAALLYASYHPRLDWTQTITGAGFSKPQH